MKEKSIAKNAMIYCIKIIASTLFPLLTFPYISRVLLPEEMGKYNFSAAIVSYFSILAALGISTYAIREGAKIRDNKDEVSELSKELYSINIISTVITIVILVMSVFAVPKLKSYADILLILSIGIPLTTIGTEWIFNIYEDYFYITVRSLIFQVISVILMFVFVKKTEDVWKYALISVLSSAGNNCLNYKRACRYFKHKFVLSRQMKKHMIPILLLFASAVASQIYVNLDTTMIGFIKGDYEVGVYSAATKVYNVLRSVLMAIITVLTPRLAADYSCHNENVSYENNLNDRLTDYIALIVPCGVGLLCLSRDVIIVLSGDAYSVASTSLQVLAVALTISLTGSFIANEILVISERENKVLLATIAGALLNFVGNCIVIPRIGILGAAITTVVSETLVLIIQFYYAKKYIRVKNVILQLVKVLTSCISILIVSNLFQSIESSIIRLGAVFILGSLGYVGGLTIMRHPVIKEFETLIKRRI